MHAAKFLPYPSGKRECDMNEKAESIDTRFIVKAICSGVARNPAACGAVGAPCIVLLFELMDGDLFDLVLSPSSLTSRILSRSCALRHIAYQLLEAIQGTCKHELSEAFHPTDKCTNAGIHEAGLTHDDIKPENVMVKVLPGCAFIKIGDFGNSISSQCDRRIGGTYAYMAPENVIGLRNRGPGGDIFAAAIVLVELACRSTIMPESLALGYAEHVEGQCSTATLRWTQLLHLVLLSSLIEQRPVYAGLVVRRYYGNISRQRTIGSLTSHFPEYDRDMNLMIVSRECSLHRTRIS